MGQFFSKLNERKIKNQITAAFQNYEFEKINLIFKNNIIKKNCSLTKKIMFTSLRNYLLNHDIQSTILFFDKSLIIHFLSNIDIPTFLNLLNIFDILIILTFMSEEQLILLIKDDILEKTRCVNIVENMIKMRNMIMESNVILKMLYCSLQINDLNKAYFFSQFLKDKKELNFSVIHQILLLMDINELNFNKVIEILFILDINLKIIPQSIILDCIDKSFLTNCDFKRNFLIQYSEVNTTSAHLINNAYKN